MTRPSLYRYVRHEQVDAALRLGWTVIDTFSGCVHGEFSMLLGWLCDCEPRWIGDADAI